MFIIYVMSLTRNPKWRFSGDRSMYYSTIHTVNQNTQITQFQNFYLCKYDLTLGFKILLITQATEHSR